MERLCLAVAAREHQNQMKPPSAAWNDHTKGEELNDLGLHFGKHRRCGVCNLPIFSTPFVFSEGSLLHDQCANLPEELVGSDVHPRQCLFLKNGSPGTCCSICNQSCFPGKFYYCPDCHVKLDVLCALPSPIKILHLSHPHRLMPIRGADLLSFACGACGTRHAPDDEHSFDRDLFYCCKACRFWIHPFCASLSDYISIGKHYHCLTLNYDYPAYSTTEDDGSTHFERRCATCHDVIRSTVFYSCIVCWYYVHIMCAIKSDGYQSLRGWSYFQRIQELVICPIQDHFSYPICYTQLRAIGGLVVEPLQLDQLHEHQLILEDDYDPECKYQCNACVQFISAPYYRCSECPNFFLHDCCYGLPSTLAQRPVHEKHLLSLRPEFRSFGSIFYCDCCGRQSNGFSYSCADTCKDFHLDVLCALMPASLIHNAHNPEHILYSSNYRTQGSHHSENNYCDCCGNRLSGKSFYECWTCKRFNLHSRCALLPDTVTHTFDEHPLKLTTTKNSAEFCEVCEGDIDSRVWYYSCRTCEQSFHTDCIPSLDQLSLIKFGDSSRIRVKCHDCPLALVRGRSVCGYRCEYCKTTFNDQDSLSWECSRCCFWMHYECARHNVVGGTVEN